MGKMIDKTGNIYGNLIVIAHSHSVFRNPRQGSYQYWICRCFCGEVKTVLANNLTTGKTKSCGCLRTELVKKMATKHNGFGTPEYRAWSSMLSRTHYSTAKKFHRYAGRGISVCKEWLNFENFIKDMGKRPSPLHTIDRINNDGDYEPTNCRWATKKQQARSRCSSRHIEHNGQTKTLAEWAEQTGMDWDTLGERLKRGWSIEKSLTTKVRSLLRTK